MKDKVRIFKSGVLVHKFYLSILNGLLCLAIIIPIWIFLEGDEMKKVKIVIGIVTLISFVMAIVYILLARTKNFFKRISISQNGLNENFTWDEIKNVSLFKKRGLGVAFVLLESNSEKLEIQLSAKFHKAVMKFAPEKIKTHMVGMHNRQIISEVIEENK